MYCQSPAIYQVQYNLFMAVDKICCFKNSDNVSLQCNQLSPYRPECQEYILHILGEIFY